MAIEHVSVSENVCALQICLVPSQYLFELMYTGGKM